MNQKENQNNEPIPSGVASSVYGFLGPSNLFWYMGLLQSKGVKDLYNSMVLHIEPEYENFFTTN